MKLAELGPVFLSLNQNDICQFARVEEIEKADGIFFLCPVCFQKNNYSSVGVHGIICWRPHVEQHPRLSGPGRWEFNGNSMETLSLIAGSSSISLSNGCRAHFFVKNGNIEFC